MAAMPITAGTATGMWVSVWVMKPAKISTVIQQVARSSGTLRSAAPVGVAAARDDQFSANGEVIEAVPHLRCSVLRECRNGEQQKR